MRTKGRAQSKNIEDRRPTMNSIIWADKVIQFRNDSFEVARQKRTPPKSYNKFQK